MADRNKGARSEPDTLASLWAKPRARSPEPARPEPMRKSSGEAQLGLLFSTVAEPEGGGRSERVRESPAADKLTQPQPIADGLPRGRRIWQVRTLVDEVRQRIESGFADVWVEGEISNLRPAPSGHIYFTLKDGEAQLPVVLFRRQAQLLLFQPQDGMAVLVRGHISIYESRGQLQLIADTLEPRGAGALQLAFEQLRDRLKAEGLFDSESKRPLPAFPRTIGVITSTHGAVLHDILNVIHRRHARLNLLIYPAVVQGPDAAATVSAGIRWFNSNPDRVDLVLIARGGGSLEDLAGFNDESLARTIAASELPVVSAVGHETDFTIADFVADLRAPTPSAAAELITAAQHRVEEHVESLDARVTRAIRYQLMLARQRLVAISAPQVLRRERELIDRRGQRVDELRLRLEAAEQQRLRGIGAHVAALQARVTQQSPALRLALVRRRVEAARLALERLGPVVLTARAARLRQAQVRLGALSPLAVLNRGYALVYAQDGSLLRDAANARKGEQVRVRLAKGSLEAEVKKSES